MCVERSELICNVLKRYIGWILLVTMIVLTCVLIFVFVPRTGGKCYDNRDCHSCVQTRTWLGTSCKWCPLDHACHTSFSPKNHCFRRLNLRHVDQCSGYSKHPFRSQYNPEEAYRLAIFSALAYSDTPDNCMDTLFPDDDYDVISVNTKECDDFMLSYYKPCLSFIVLSHNNSEVIVSYRGSRGANQVLDQTLAIVFIPAVTSVIGGRVQRYFQAVHQTLFADDRDTLISLAYQYPEYTFTFTGHSLGGAVASLTAAILVHDKILRSDQVVLYTFGMPRVGDKRFALAHDKLVPNSWRVVRQDDVVARLPICRLASCARLNGPYHHQTKVLYTDDNMTVDSDYIVCKGNEDSIKKCREKSRVRRSVFTGGLSRHKVYFGIPIGTYCRDNILNNNNTVV